MADLKESDIEELAIELLEEQGYTYLSPDDQETEREGSADVIFEKRLKSAIDRLNPDIPKDARQDAFRQVRDVPTHSLIDNNEAFHLLLTEGVPVEYQKKGNTVGDLVRLLDFENLANNDFAVCNQFVVSQNEKTRKPDLVLFVNGMPLAVIEMKSASDEKATVDKAFTQLQNYKNDIPDLFCYNAVLVASDGFDAQAGSLNAARSRFVPWKTIDGTDPGPTTPQIEVLVKGMLRPDVFLDLIRHFTVFDESPKKKKVAAYHQYDAVNKAVESAIRATGSDGNRKAGIVWHTQGSGKSLSMVFYAGKLIVHPEMKNPTIVVVTDRNDLDDQLFKTFADNTKLLRQKPEQAESKDGLKDLLKTAGGGVVFTTIHKFSPKDMDENFEMLSERSNIVVIADEAHRSQYGFAAKTHLKDDEVHTKYGFAKYLRDALPNASFVGFTGTPIENEDISTPAVFGEYIDIYDIQKAVDDGATVPIYYESRLAKVHLKDEHHLTLDAEIDQITENEEPVIRNAAKWAQIEAIVGSPERLKDVAADIVEHFEARQGAGGLGGKAMIVSMSRKIAVDLYSQIVALRPDWHDDERGKGAIKVVMTSSSSDPESFQPHRTNKTERRELGNRFRDPADPLKLAIVCNMWLTGFDAPCLNTMYLDKYLKEHNLMQAIARVNRVDGDKRGGLIVDYIGIAASLKQAVSNYTESGGEGVPTFDQSEAIDAMIEKHQIVCELFHGFDFARYFLPETDAKAKLVIVLEAQEHILGLKDGKERFFKQIQLLSEAYALSLPSDEAMAIKGEVAFFQFVKTRLVKFEATSESGKGGKSPAEMETAVRQLVDEAIAGDGVIDVFAVAGLPTPDISILSDDFLDEVRGMERKNTALELLKKVLNDEARIRFKRNIIQGKKISERLREAILKYENNLLTAAQIIEELIEIAKEIRRADEMDEATGLSEYEIAFYHALADNESAKEVLGNEILRELAQILVREVRKNASIDWTIRKSVRAKLRTIVKRKLTKYGYPPDLQKMAVDNVISQAELFADSQVG